MNQNEAGKELAPSDWHKEMQFTATHRRHPLVSDSRSDYETEQGTFTNAKSLNTATFSESWDKLQQVSETAGDKNFQVYIFCTGGIRCVKVGAYLKQPLGFTNIKRLAKCIIGFHKLQGKQGQGGRAVFVEGRRFPE